MEKLQTYLKSLIIENFKNVHHFAATLFCQNLYASKVSPRFIATFGMSQKNATKKKFLDVTFLLAWLEVN